MITVEFNRTYMGIHDMWKDLGWRIEKEFESDNENANVLIWYAWRIFGEGLQKAVIIGNKIKNNVATDNDKTVNEASETTKEVENVKTEIANVSEANDTDSDIDTVVEVDHEEKNESEFTLDVNTAVYAGSQIKDMYEGTGISFIDYHYLYLIGDTAREMERQLEKMEYVAITEPDVPASSVESTESIESPESSDSSNTTINGFEVTKEEEQALLGGEF